MVRKEYKELSESSKKKYDSVLRKAYDSGYSFKELRQMDNKDFAKALNISETISNVLAHRRVVNQIQFSKESRTETINRVKEKFEKDYTKEQLRDIERDLQKTAGNIFTAISKEIYDKYYSDLENKDKAERKANLYTKKLLLIPDKEKKNLNTVDKDILSDFGY